MIRVGVAFEKAGGMGWCNNKLALEGDIRFEVFSVFTCGKSRCRNVGMEPWKVCVCSMIQPRVY